MAAERQLSVRSARASELAHRLAARERRSIAHIVERALDLYARQSIGEEPASEFYARLSRNAAAEKDIDIEALARADRQPHHGIDL
ncbi:plasmid stabilization protein [Labrys monachus]|uniref:Plasmid stabilization protein n=1 Tax=Labrys monachus TaxID=217067 RepID=A0ABU0FMX3_9HYPH|nr:plasmid stabilization protein [Labrys monachus]MDQ0395821.1 hypothetical protein [Labrys monachus]